MRYTIGKERGSAVIEFALSSMVLIPLFFGTVALGLNLGRFLQVTQVSRDVAVLYSRGINFSKPGSQAIAQKLANGLDLSATGNSAIVLSQVTMVHNSDCASAGYDDCPNAGSLVFLNRIVVGNGSLRASNYGSPGGIGDEGNIAPSVYLREAGARANAKLQSELAAAGVAQRQGEIAFIVEAWFDTPNLNPFGTVSTRGVYANSIF